MTTTELHHVLVCYSDLHSSPELYDNILVWHLYKDAYVQAYCNNGDTCIEIISESLFLGSLMHWHPDEDNMLDELHALGKKGNMLVLKKTLLGTSTFYIGPVAHAPLSDGSKLHFGKKKWDGGQLIYLEQK